MKQLFFLMIFLIGTNEIAFSANTTIRLEQIPAEDVVYGLQLDEKQWLNRDTLIDAIDNSLYYLKTASAKNAYRELNLAGFDDERVTRSLNRFRELLIAETSYDNFKKKIIHEFGLYRIVSSDNSNVRFTGYFRPVYQASKVKTKEYKYPLFSLPEGFNTWTTQPTRVELEGTDGLGTDKLKGLEIAWLKSRYEVYMVQVQGSAILELTDGTRITVGFAGGTKYPFSAVAKQFIAKHGFYPKDPERYFVTHQSEFDRLISQNNRFIFFEVKRNSAPIGSLGVPVVDERSIATDKRIMPPGALAFIYAPAPEVTSTGGVKVKKSGRFVLDHDTGSAIKGTGRVDIFMGTGEQAKKKATSIYASGDLFYLLLK